MHNFIALDLNVFTTLTQLELKAENSLNLLEKYDVDNICLCVCICVCVCIDEYMYSRKNPQIITSALKDKGFD